MGYAAPIGNAVDFNFTETGYAPPGGASVAFEFGAVNVIEPTAAVVQLLAAAPVLLPVMPGAGSIRLDVSTPSLGSVVAISGPGSVRLVPGTTGGVAGVGTVAPVITVVVPAPAVNLPEHVLVEAARLAVSLPSPSIVGVVGPDAAAMMGFGGYGPDVGGTTSPSIRTLRIVRPAPGIGGGRIVEPSLVTLLVDGRDPASLAGILDASAGIIRVLESGPPLAKIGPVVSVGIVPIMRQAPIAVAHLEPTLAVLRLIAGGTGGVWSADLAVTQVVYRFTLTGSPDVVIPISSIQGRLRDGKPTYLSVVIPSMAYAPDVSARADGEMIVSRGYRFANGDTTWQEIARADLDSIRMDEGPMSGSITLVGYATITNDTPKTVTLEGAGYRSVGADGKRRYRCALNMFLRPGDSAVINGESFVVGSITYTIGTKIETMEIVEA